MKQAASNDALLRIAVPFCERAAEGERHLTIIQNNVYLA